MSDQATEHTWRDLPIHAPNWPECKRFAAIQSQLLDIDLSLNVIRRARVDGTAESDPVAHHALVAMALVYYARAFKSGVRKSCTVDELALDASLMAEHRRLIDLRDKWLAHSVNALDQVAVGVILSGPEDDATVVDTIRIRLRTLNAFADSLDSLDAHIRQVRSQLSAANQKAYEELLARARATSAREIRRFPEVAVTTPGVDHDTIKRRR